MAQRHTISRITYKEKVFSSRVGKRTKFTKYFRTFVRTFGRKPISDIRTSSFFRTFGHIGLQEPVSDNFRTLKFG